MATKNIALRIEDEALVKKIDVLTKSDFGANKRNKCMNYLLQLGLALYEDGYRVNLEAKIVNINQ